MKPPIVFSFLACACNLILAADPVEIKTKPDQVRDMSTDRPDQTEGAFTVPKGWFQVEMGLLSFSQRLDTDNRDVAFAWSEMNVKYGLTENTDFQFIWVPYNQTRQKGDPGTDDTNRAGTGDIIARFKWNLVGNDGGPFAMSLLPYVKIPTAKHRIGNDMWEGGLYLNTEIDLGGGFTLGNSVFGGLAIDGDVEHYMRPGATAVLGYDITQRLAWYGEFFTAWQYDTERYWQTSLDSGFTHMLTENLQLDLSVFWFLRGDESIQPLVGLSWRF